MSFVASKTNRAFSHAIKQQKNEMVSLASVKFRYFNRVRIVFLSRSGINICKRKLKRAQYIRNI